MTDREMLLEVLEFCKTELGNDRDSKYEAMCCNDHMDYYRYCGQTLSYARVIDKIESLLGRDNEDENEED